MYCLFVMKAFSEKDVFHYEDNLNFCQTKLFLNTPFLISVNRTIRNNKIPKWIYLLYTYLDKACILCVAVFCIYLTFNAFYSMTVVTITYRAIHNWIKREIHVICNKDANKMQVNLNLKAFIKVKSYNSICVAKLF